MTQMAETKDSDLDIKVLEAYEIRADTDHDSPSKHPEIPDGGWGWFVCAGTFIVNFIVFGIHNSFGVVYANLLDELKMGKAETGEFLILNLNLKNILMYCSLCIDNNAGLYKLRTERAGLGREMSKFDTISCDI